VSVWGTLYCASGADEQEVFVCYVLVDGRKKEGRKGKEEREREREREIASRGGRKERLLG
jgi:hypothetical protein